MEAVFPLVLTLKPLAAREESHASLPHPLFRNAKDKIATSSKPKKKNVNVPSFSFQKIKEDGS